jgi:hypothetical protein
MGKQKIYTSIIMAKLGGRNMEGKYTKIRWSYIVGYVDHNDLVHSRMFPLFGEDFEDSETKTHYDIFGMVLKGWRWDFDRGLDATIGDKNLDREDFERVREHLLKCTTYHSIQMVFMMCRSSVKKWMKKRNNNG